MDEMKIVSETAGLPPSDEDLSGFSAVRPSFRLALLGALYFGSISLAPCVMFAEPIAMASLLALPLAGAFAFGFAGVVGGWLGFTLFGAWKSPTSARGLDVGMVLALTLGGALLGADLDRTGKPTDAARS